MSSMVGTASGGGGPAAGGTSASPSPGITFACASRRPVNAFGAGQAGPWRVRAFFASSASRMWRRAVATLVPTAGLPRDFFAPVPVLPFAGAFPGAAVPVLRRVAPLPAAPAVALPLPADLRGGSFRAGIFLPGAFFAGAFFAGDLVVRAAPVAAAGPALLPCARPLPLADFLAGALAGALAAAFDGAFAGVLLALTRFVAAPPVGDLRIGFSRAVFFAAVFAAPAPSPVLRADDLRAAEADVRALLPAAFFAGVALPDPARFMVGPRSAMDARQARHARQ
jgi:hypothetical protein